MHNSNADLLAFHYNRLQRAEPDDRVALRFHGEEQPYVFVPTFLALVNELLTPPVDYRRCPDEVVMRRRHDALRKRVVASAGRRRVVFLLKAPPICAGRRDSPSTVRPVIAPPPRLARPTVRPVAVPPPRLARPTVRDRGRFRPPPRLWIDHARAIGDSEPNDSFEMALDVAKKREFIFRSNQYLNKHDPVDAQFRPGWWMTKKEGVVLQQQLAELAGGRKIPKQRKGKKGRGR